MKFFYLSSIQDFEGGFKIHHKDCPNFPNMYQRDYLGPFNSGVEALRKAIHFNPNAQLCKCCCKENSSMVKVSSNVAALD